MNRTIQPPIQEINKLKITLPQHTVLTNGIPLHIINAGTQEVVRLDFLFKGGSWHQQKPLQALLPIACCVKEQTLIATKN